MSTVISAETSVLDLDVLLIEDATSEAELAIWRLMQGGFRCRYRVVGSEEGLRQALAERIPGIMVSEFNLPGFDGMAVLAVAAGVAPEVPFIFFSGAIGEERVIEALRCGAVDYVLKSNPLRLVPAVKRALEEAALRRANRLAEQRAARVTRVLQMLSGINAAVVRIQDRPSLLQEACRLAHRVGGYSVAMIAMIDSRTRTAHPVAASGPAVEKSSGLVFPLTQDEGADMSLTSRVIRTGEDVFCDDLAETTLPVSGRDAFLADGIRSLACLPLRVDQTTVGTFMVGAREPGPVGRDELQLLHEVAANLSFALQYLEKKDAVNFLNFFDPLTGLAKRALFCERLGRLSGREPAPRLAVEVFDVDHLSVINDSYGRHVGDRLLQCVADRLKAQCPDTDRLAHLGGGTFVLVVVLEDGERGEPPQLYREVLRMLEQPFILDGREIAVTVKCGFAFHPENGRDPNQLVQNAEAALKEAKSSGEQYLHHRVEMNSALAARVRMEHRLRAALGNNQFELHYQPKLSLRTGRIETAEALLRWRDPERGLVVPGSFLPILESAGLMAAVDAWALNQAASDCREWRRAGLPPVRVAVNVSPAELRRRGFEHEVVLAAGTLADHGGWGVDIEVTEGALLGDSTTCVQALRFMRNAGIRIAIDDFGTGYSSLARLSELPIDTLKIDRVFTRRLPQDRRIGTLVATIIDLAHAFDMTTVAEGVETQAQLDYLARAGCDESQGYLHSRPIPRAEFEQLLLKVNTNPTPAFGFEAEDLLDEQPPAPAFETER
jgi:diguanylate cyclase (GGDEF)-like protein